MLPKYKTVIFVNACFWHHHKDCKIATTPKSNTEYWMEKFNRNIENDKRHRSELQEMGWRVITIWECELKNDFDGRMNKVENEIVNNVEY